MTNQTFKQQTFELQTIELQAIGFVRSPFKEKFGIPRQPGLIKSCKAKIELIPPYNNPDAVRGLDDFSHIWLTFQFHQNTNQTWRPLIRPPRLGGNKKVGVFASRSPFRPNNLGLSLVALHAVHTENNATTLIIDCPDILDGTPILDIKPYIAYSDAALNARCSFANASPAAKMKVKFSQDSQRALEPIENQYEHSLKSLIEETLAYDPRPAYKQKDDSREYGICLYDLNIIWRVAGDVIEVIEIQK